MTEAADDRGIAPEGRRWLRWAPVLVAVLHGLSLADLGPVDDDYIVYRYARNWLAGLGPVLNPGEVPVEGVTSPAWFLIVALGLKLGAAPSLWTPLVGIVSFAVLVATVGAWARARRPGALAELAPWWVALSPAVAWHAVAGLGTVPLAAALAVGAATWDRWGGRGEGTVWAPSAAFALACTLRAEAALAWGAWLVLARPRRPLGAVERIGALLPLFALGLVAAVRWSVHGQLTPHALALKALPLGAELEYGSAYLVRSLREGGLSLLLLLALLTPRQAAQGRALACTAALALVSVLAVGGDWIVYSRFLVPFVSIGAVGAVEVVGALRAAPARRVASCTLLLLGLAGVGARPQAALEQRFIEQHWLQIGAAFGELAPRGSTVASSPIGAFGWASGLEVVDVLGLTHPHFLGEAPDLAGVGVKGHHRHDGAWVLDQEPSYLVLGNGVVQPATGTLDVNPWERDILEDPRFEARYRALTLDLPGPLGQTAVPYYAREGVRGLR